MSRLVVLLFVTYCALGACNESRSESSDTKVDTNSLPSLLQAHDKEVAAHGKDLKYISHIGRFGRKGVFASLGHLNARGERFSSYNGMELIFGVAEEAKSQTGYDICDDKEAIVRLRSALEKSSAPSYEISVYKDMLSRYCAT